MSRKLLTKILGKNVTIYKKIDNKRQQVARTKWGSQALNTAEAQKWEKPVQGRWVHTKLYGVSAPLKKAEEGEEWIRRGKWYKQSHRNENSWAFKEQWIDEYDCSGWIYSAQVECKAECVDCSKNETLRMQDWSIHVHKRH